MRKKSDPSSAAALVGAAVGIRPSRSVAKARQGAGSVLAVDIDEVAVANARENLQHNRIDPDQVEVRWGSLDAVAEEGVAM